MGESIKTLGMKSGNGTIVRCTKLRREVLDSEGEGGRRAGELETKQKLRSLRSHAVKPACRSLESQSNLTGESW